MEGKIKMNVYYLLGEALIIIVMFFIVFNYLTKKTKSGYYFIFLASISCSFLLDIRRKFLQGGNNSIATAFTIVLIIVYFIAIFFRYKNIAIRKKHGK